MTPPPWKTRVNTFLCSLLFFFLFFFLMCMSLSTLFLMVLKGNLPGRVIKKAERNVIVHYGAGGRASSGLKERLWWKYFKIILKESSDVISCRSSCREWGFLGHRTECGMFKHHRTREDRDKRTHCPEAVVGRHRADTVLIYLFKQDLSTFSDETYRDALGSLHGPYLRSKQSPEEGCKISGGNSQKIIERDLV